MTENPLSRDGKGLQFSGPLYILAPFPRPADSHLLLKGALRGSAQKKDGTVCVYAPVFTTADLAEECRVGLVPGLAAKLKPLTFPSKHDFAAALVHLATEGVTHVAFDPESDPDAADCFDISRVIAAASGTG
ncbi:MAG: hypothetical protein JWO38_7116 [Gemmataceae bacterium]|nr:hypothetical protein [Gemmataceae bacterium]